MDDDDVDEAEVVEEADGRTMAVADGTPPHTTACEHGDYLLHVD